MKSVRKKDYGRPGYRIGAAIGELYYPKTIKKDFKCFD